ncbi:MAG: hypothetical protein GY845_18360, partial [Planctomycetes bacterium]|nr:hypothetical protein [Planctomycetota bacterium]
PFITWLRENNLKGIIGEIGCPPEPDCWIERLRDTFEYVVESQDVLVGLCYSYAGRRPDNLYGSNIWPWAGKTSDNVLRIRPQGDLLEEFAMSPAPEPPVPELASSILMSLGLLTFGGYIRYRMYKLGIAI